MGQSYKISFIADMEIQSALAAVKKLKDSLGSKDIKISGSIDKNLQEKITTLTKNLETLQGSIGEEVDESGYKKLLKIFEQVQTNMKNIAKLTGDIWNSEDFDIEKLLPKAALDRLNNAKKAIEEYNKAIDDKNVKKNLDTLPDDSSYKTWTKRKKELEGQVKSNNITIGKKEEGIEKYQEKVDNAQACLDKLEEINKKIKEEEEKINGTTDKPGLKEQLDKAEKNLKGNSKYKRKLELQGNRQASLDEIANIEAALKVDTVTGKKRNAADALLAEYGGREGAQTALEGLKQFVSETEAELEKLAKVGEKRDKLKRQLDTATANKDAFEKQKEDILGSKEYKKWEEDLKQLEKLKKQRDDLLSANEEAKTGTDGIDELNQKIKDVQESAKAGQFEKLKQDLTALGIEGIDSAQSLEDINKILEKLKGENAEKAKEALNKIREALEGVTVAADPVNKLGDNLDDAGEKAKAAEKDFEQLQGRLAYFFSAVNMVRLFKKTVNEAVKTIGDLDKAMQETAVVTDFSIGDMWNKLPEYTKQASELGASTLDMYKATALYYQQGLNTSQAMALGTETLKMARIAGMQGAEATQAMTAALRGFNMELNEVSAQRVNDVYSKLAAITASDTSQIATAMSKTASIANSANMKFETTAAFLAQIIETTQEAPEPA